MTREKSKAFILMIVPLAICTYVMILFLSEQVRYSADWRSAYALTKKFGDDCDVAVGKWLEGDSFQKVAVRDHQYAKLSLPYRANQPHKDLEAGEYMIARCRVDFSTIKKDGYAWLNLGPVFGDSAVFIGDSLRSTVDDDWNAELPILPDERLANQIVTVISRKPLKTADAGLASLLPLAFSDSRKAMEAADAMLTSFRVSRPLFFSGYTIALTLALMVAWLLGMRFPDLFWMIVISSLMTLDFFTLYVPTGAWPQYLDKISAVCRLGIALGFGQFILSHLKRPVNWVGPVLSFASIMILYGLWLASVSDRLVLKLKLPGVVPSYVTAAVFSICVVLGLKALRHIPDFRRRRAGVFLGLCCFGALIFTSDAILISKYAVYFGFYFNALFLTVFCLFLFVDLASFYRHFNSERERRLSQEREFMATQAVAEATQMLAHDVRIPLNNLKLGLAFLNQAEGVAEVKKAATLLQTELAKAFINVEGMIADVMQAGSSPLMGSDSVSVRLLIFDSLNEVSKLHESKNVRFQYELLHDSKIRGDRSKLLRVLINLLTNAIEAVNEGGVVAFKTSQGDTKSVKFEINNSGTPIPSDVQQKLFVERITSKTAGNGLGLAVVKKIVENHGGTVEFQSDVDRGTSFFFSIPKSSEEDDVEINFPPSLNYFSEIVSLPIADASQKSSQAEKNTKKMKIILVEDDPFVRMSWQVLPYAEVTAFVDPEEFEVFLTSHPQGLSGIDLVFTDYLFANNSTKDGMDVARLVKAQSKVPVVLATNYSFKKNPDTALFEEVTDKGLPTQSQLERIVPRSRPLSR